MKKILISFFVLIYFNCDGQVTFERRDSNDVWSGLSDGVPNAILETPDHGFLSSGTIANGLINLYYWEKIDSTGHQLWGHTFGYGLTDAYIYSAALTTDGGFILSGRCSSCGLMG